MGGAHRRDGHACYSRTEYSSGRSQVIHYRVHTSARLTDAQLQTVATLARPRLFPVARITLACVGVFAAAIMVVSTGRVIAPVDPPEPVAESVAPAAAPVAPIVSRPSEPSEAVVPAVLAVQARTLTPHLTRAWKPRPTVHAKHSKGDEK